MRKILKLITIVVLVLQTLNFLGQSKLSDEFHLEYKKKNKTIRSNKDVRIISDWHKGSDTLQVEIHPQSDSVFFVSKDTFEVRPRAIFIQTYVGRGNLNQGSPYYPLNTTYVIKLPISAIEKITVARDAIQFTTTVVGYLALTSALIVAPLASIDKKFNFDRYKKVAGYSLITAVTALTINLTFGHKKYHLKKCKNKKIWTLN